jgi:SOS-response transcriptional repressor LexA
MNENTIKLFRKRAGYSQKEVANALHVTTAAVSSWEKGRYSPDQQNLSALADLFGVTVDALLGRTTPLEQFGRQIVVKPELVPEDEVMIPLVASLRCGYDYAGEQFSVIRKIPVPKSYITRWGTNLIALEAVGRSMLPTIRPGDLMICIPGDDWESGQIVIVDINDSDTVKRIFLNKQDGGIDLVPDNEEFEPMHYTPEDWQLYQGHVLGRVVKAIGPDL